jgi:hypothetical protein
VVCSKSWARDSGRGGREYCYFACAGNQFFVLSWAASCARSLSYDNPFYWCWASGLDHVGHLGNWRKRYICQADALHAYTLSFGQANTVMKFIRPSVGLKRMVMWAMDTIVNKRTS